MSDSAYLVRQRELDAPKVAARARALVAIERTIRIYTAAGDRELTTNQRRDRQILADEFRAATDELGGIGEFAEWAGNGERSTARELAAVHEARAQLDALTFQSERLAKLEARPDGLGPVRAVLADADTSGIHHHRGSTMHAEFRDFREILMNAANGRAGVFESSWSPEFAEQRALQSLGGSAVPVTLADYVTVYQRTMNPVYGVARVLGRSSGAPITLPRLTADAAGGIGGTVTAEAAGLTVADPTISSVTLSPFKVGGITLVSTELWQDETIGLENLIAEAIARPIALGLGSYFTLGVGGTCPTGFLTTASVGGTAGGTATGTSLDTFVSPADITALLYSLQAPYRQNATWMVSSTAMARIAGQRDTTGQPIWRPGFGAPDLLLGRPIYENPAMAALASATKSIAVGDFSRYYIAEVQPLRIEVSKDAAWGTDQISIRVISRADGVLADAAAVKVLQSANT